MGKKWHLTKEEIQLASKYMKTCSPSLVAGNAIKPEGYCSVLRLECLHYKNAK